MIKIRCPFCNSSKLKVIDKRSSNDLSIRRRRECLKCKQRFTTYERIEPIELIVIKKDNRREKFDRNKIKNGILKACEKRAISIEQLDKIVDEVEQKLRKLNKKEVKSNYIGELIMKKLKNLDRIAYIRFASVYKEFEDVDSFKEEIKSLNEKK